MKKWMLYLGFASLTLLVMGCGGGGSSSTNSSGSTTVTVTKGPVLHATVKDNAGKQAKEEGETNKYVFYGSIVYPITATGGYYDAGDGNKYPLQIPLSTDRGTLITGITTYLSGLSSEREKEEFANKYGVKLDDLYSDKFNPEPGASKMLVALNIATYIHKVDSNKSIDELITTYKSDFDIKNDNITNDNETADNDTYVNMEEGIASDLGLMPLTQDEIEKIKNAAVNENDNVTNDDENAIGENDNVTNVDENDNDNVTGDNITG